MEAKKISEAGRRFNEYHTKNPQVFKMFRRFAEEARASGLKHFGAKAVIERVRWETAISGSGSFKVNNNYTSRYARLLEIVDPSFKGFFRNRELRYEE